MELYLECVKKFQNSKVKKKERPIQLENGLKMERDISPKRIHKWQITLLKDFQHNQLLEKCKLKLHWPITTNII